MKIFISGDKGFVGRHLKQYFLQNYPHAEIMGCDIKDEPTFDIRYVCQPQYDNLSEQFDIVFHCAAIVGGRETIENEPLKIATDLTIDADIFNWAIRTKQKKFVYFSSSAAYPTRLQHHGAKLVEFHINLDNIKNPDMMYGWSKLTGEYVAEFARTQGLDVHIFRPFSGYGEDQDNTYPFPALVRRGFNRENPFVIWGGKDTVRDWIHIDDIIEAIMVAIKNDIKGPVNLGTGVPTTFWQFANKIIKQIPDYSPKIEVDYTKPRGVPYRCADVTQLHQFYFPKITLDEGIERALRSLN